MPTLFHIHTIVDSIYYKLQLLHFPQFSLFDYFTFFVNTFQSLGIFILISYVNKIREWNPDLRN